MLYFQMIFFLTKWFPHSFPLAFAKRRNKHPAPVPTAHFKHFTKHLYNALKHQMNFLKNHMWCFLHDVYLLHRDQIKCMQVHLQLTVHFFLFTIIQNDVWHFFLHVNHVFNMWIKKINQLKGQTSRQTLSRQPVYCFKPVREFNIRALLFTADLK